MPQQVDTTELNNIANTSFEDFRDAYRNGGNIARDYYEELERQGRDSGNQNIESYASLAGDVTTNSGSNGKTANAFSKAAARDDDVTFDVGSDAWLRMQHSLMVNDNEQRNRNITQGGSGELDYRQTNDIHTVAFRDVGISPEGYTLYTPTNNLGNVDPALAQTLFEDLIRDDGVGDNMFMDGLGIDILNDWADVTDADYYEWLQNFGEAILDDPSILGDALTEELQDLIDAANESLAPWFFNAFVERALSQWIQDALQPIFDTPGVGPHVVFYGTFSPLVLDLDGNGIDLTNMDGSNAYFDFWGDGYAEKTGWVAPSDGLLTLDINGNGSIDDVSELFGSGYPLGYFSYNNTIDIGQENGFAKLAVHDSNGDGQISAADDVWDSLQVWQDANQDGVSDAGELLGLDALGIESIDIEHYQLDTFGANGAQAATFNRIIEDNVITHTSAYTKTDGTQHEIVDAWFQLEQQQTFYKPDYTLDVRTLFLPTLRGYGQISDLHIAMSIDNGAGGLLEQVQSFSTGRDFAALFSDFNAVRNEVESILYNWTGIDAQTIRDNPSYGEHGLFEQMPEYHFIRQFMGQDSDFIGTWFDQSAFLPRVGSAVNAITEGWDNIVDAFAARLIFQVGGGELFDTGVSYNPFSDVFEGAIDLSQAQITALETEATTHTDTEGFWHSFATFVDQIKGLENLTVDEVSWISSSVSNSSAFTWTDIVASLGENTITGQSGDDVITGTRWDDVITGYDGDETLIGGAGNDILYAREPSTYAGANDILDGGLGNDRLYGGWGDDIFRYDYGHDVIAGASNATFQDFDIIEFGAGINPDDVSFHYSPKNASQDYAKHAVFEVAGRGSISVELVGYGSNDYELIDELHFADGTIVSTADMLIHMHGSYTGDDSVSSSNWGYNNNVVLYGYDGNDSLYANSTITSFADGGLGNDTFWGSTGDDTLYLSSGDDQFYGGGGNNKILLHEGYTLDDVSFYRWSDPNQSYPSDIYRNDALIEIEGLGSVSILSLFSGSDDRLVQTLEFSDGSTVDLLSQRYITIGSSGNDNFNYSGGTWANQSDTYLFSEGHDIIREYTGDHDTLLFGAGYQFSDLTIYKQDRVSLWSENNNLMIEDHLGNSTQIFQYFNTGFNNGGYVLEHLEFADGSAVNLADLSFEIRGDDSDNSITGIENGSIPNDDTIYAYGGDDSIYTRLGNDIAYGGAGNDQILGEDGDDSLYGEDGNDNLDGNNGHDILDGGAGDDDIDGGYGEDLLIGGAGSDQLDGSYDDDTLVYTLTGNNGYYDTYKGGTGVDTLRVNLTSAEYSVPLYNDLQNFVSYAAANYNVNSNYGAAYSFDYIGLFASDIENLEVYVDGVLTSSAPVTVAQNPTTNDDEFYAQKDNPRSGNLFDDNGNGKDFDFNGDAITAFAETKTTTQGGSVAINSDGSFVYTPLAGYMGLDSFDYTLLTMVNGDSTIGQVSLNVFDVPVPDVIEGTAAEDRLNGTSDANILISKAGDDESYGAEGDDTYIYNLGDGNDFIFDNAGIDKLQFGAGISLTDIRFWNQGIDLELYFHGSKITLDKQFHSTWTSQIEQAVFADGSSLDLLNDLTFTGTDEEENVAGLAEKNDVLIGGAGDDDLRGNTGDDTYIYNLGDGSDTINDTGGVDKIVFGEGILPSDVRLLQSSHLMLHIGSEVLTIEYQYHSSWGYEVETVEFADGTVWDLLNNLTFTGSDLGEYVGGFADKDDILIGGKGDDDLYGNTGNDEYLYDLGDGSDLIADNGGVDKIVFGSDITVDDIRLFRSQNDLLIKIGYETITLDNQYSTYGYEIETAEFSDGTSINLVSDVTFKGSYAAENVTAIDNDSDDKLFGYGGDDLLQGQAGDDQLNGGIGDDHLYGGQGNDTYIYNFGDGSDLITDYGGVDKIVFGANITVDELSFFRSGNDLQIAINGEIIEIDNQFSTYGYEVETAEFEDGSILSLTSNLTVTGTNSAENVFAIADSDDTLIGLQGNDHLYGLSGHDIAVYSGIYSNYTITNNGSFFTVNDNVGSDGIDLLYEIEQINFSDGTYDLATAVFTPAPAGNIVTGTANNDVLVGTADDDVMYGLDGDDKLKSSAGDNTLDGGAGNDYAHYLGSSSGVSVDLVAGTANNGNGGIDTLVDIEYVHGSGHGDDITGDDQNNRVISNGGDDIVRGGGGNDNLQGRDGDDTLYGGAGNDKLYGNDDDDVLYGGLGQDNLFGGADADTFVFEAATAFDGNVDRIKGFSLSDNDAIDISDLLSGYDATTDAISDFVSITDNGTHSFLEVDIDGGADNFVQIARIDNVTGLNVTTLVASGNLIVGDGVPPVNTAPIAVDDAFVGDEDVQIIGNVLVDNGNGVDNDPDGDTLSVIAGTFATVQGGSVVMLANGDFTYTPDTGFFGSDSFNYTLSDSDLTDTATVNITVNDVVEPPVTPNTPSGSEYLYENGVSISNIADANGVNLGDTLGKTQGISFTTGNDINTTQMLYEQGGGSRGLNLFIANGKLYAAVWNKAEENWGYKELEVDIAANTQYTATLVMDGAMPSNGTADLYLNGTLVDSETGIGQLYSHNGDIGVGRVDDNTVVGNATITDASTFTGSIEKLVHYNSALNSADVAQLNEYLAYEHLPVTPSEQVIAEFGSIDADHTGATVTLDHSFIDPVVFVTMTTNNDSAIAVPRLTDVQSDSFTLYAQEADYLDGIHAIETFSYIVIEKDSWELSDGTKFEVGTIDTNVLAKNGFEDVLFTTNFASGPSVLSQVQTNNDTAMVATRQDNTDANGFDLALTEQESTNTGSHGTETIGWFAIEQGIGSDDGHDFLAGSTGDTFTQDFDDILFNDAFDELPQLLANISTHDGADASFVRVQNLTENGVEVKVAEDQSRDTELTHTTEVFDYFAIEGTGTLTGTDNSGVV